VTLDRAGQSTLRFPLSGTMHGYTIGRVGFINVVRSRLTRANLRPAATDVLTDTACGGVPTAAIRTSPSARITFDPRHANVSSLDARTAESIASQCGAASLHVLDGGGQRAWRWNAR